MTWPTAPDDSTLPASHMDSGTDVPADAREQVLAMKNRVDALSSTVKQIVTHGDPALLPGRLLRVTRRTTPLSVDIQHNWISGAKWVIAELQAPGGGGGGAATGTTSDSRVGAGGGSGSYLKLAMSIVGRGAFAIIRIGAGGAGGGVGLAGASGGETRFQVDGWTSSLAIAYGGGGGQTKLAVPYGSQSTLVGGTQGLSTFALPSSPEILVLAAIAGEDGGMPLILGAGTTLQGAYSGAGARSPMGVGGRALITVNGAGEAPIDTANQFGGGGGGARAVGTASGFAGAAGAPGCVQIWEFC